MNCRQLKLQAPDGKMRETDCANTEGLFRIIQSIPSPKAEPFKRWLAKVGYERVQEIEDPELGSKRTRMLYRLKGYPESWIENRMRELVAVQKLDPIHGFFNKVSAEYFVFELCSRRVHVQRFFQFLMKHVVQFERGDFYIIKKQFL